jgi:hypothetical protein
VCVSSIGVGRWDCGLRWSDGCTNFVPRTDDLSGSRPYFPPLRSNVGRTHACRSVWQTLSRGLSVEALVNPGGGFCASRPYPVTLSGPCSANGQRV